MQARTGKGWRLTLCLHVRVRGGTPCPPCPCRSRGGRLIACSGVHLGVVGWPGRGITVLKEVNEVNEVILGLLLLTGQVVKQDLKCT